MLQKEFDELENLVYNIEIDNDLKWEIFQKSIINLNNLNEPVSPPSGTILGVVLKYGNNVPLEIIELLLKKGVDPNIQDQRYDRTPLSFIKNSKELELLHKYGADLNDSSYLINHIFTPEIFYKHLELGYNFKNSDAILINILQYNDWTYKENNLKDIANLLIENGLEINNYLSFNNNITILHYTTIVVHSEILEMLLKKNIKIDNLTLDEIDDPLLEQFTIGKNSSFLDIFELRKKHSKELENKDSLHQKIMEFESILLKYNLIRKESWFSKKYKFFFS